MRSDDLGGTGERERLALLTFAHDLGRQSTFGGFVSRTLEHLATTFDSPLMTFNRLDFGSGCATVISWPYRPEHEVAVDLVNGQIADHPLMRWAPRQHVWPVVRLSDVATNEQLATSSLYTQVLCPLGAAFSLFIFLSSTQSSQWVYFVANRATRDFDDRELAQALALQAPLVAEMSRWSATLPAVAPIALTAQEQNVLRLLAVGLTADAMAHALGSRPATVRKHLQNTYGKLAVQDRLSAVVRAREIGLLNEEDLSGELRQQIRVRMHFASAALSAQG